MNTNFLKMMIVCGALLLTHPGKAMDAQVLHAAREAREKAQPSEQQRIALLKKTAENYRLFLANCGKVDEKYAETIASMEQLFSQHVIKMVGPDIIAMSLSEVFDQVHREKQSLRSWEVFEEQPCIIDPLENRMAVYYRIPVASGNTIYVMKFLSCGIDGRIKKIQEVFVDKPKQP